MLAQWKDKTIAVLMGGVSKEREISLKSGQAILNSLQRQGYQAVGVDVGDRLAEQLLELKPAGVVIALHGRFGEDGTVQGLLEMMRIPYSGSGVLASALCLDKAMTKDVLANTSVKLARSMVLHDPSEIDSACRSFALKLPVVIKPNREGSTLGIEIIKEKENLSTAFQQAFRYDTCVMAEEFISGTEITVGLINGQALPVLELVPHSGFYDFEAKYTPGKTDYIVPARIPAAVAQQVQAESEYIYKRLRLHGVVRVDYIVAKNGDPYFLEVNTIPGMTATSLVPKAAAHINKNFDQVVEAILESISLMQ